MSSSPKPGIRTVIVAITALASFVSRAAELPPASAAVDSPVPPPPSNLFVAAAPAAPAKLGPVLPEQIRLWEEVLGAPLLEWMHEERLRVFGWANGGFTWNEADAGLLRVAPRPNRFADEWLLNQLALVVERTLDPREWSWGFRTEFYCGADAALLRPLNGFGPDDNPRFGTDLRQLFVALHLPVLTEGGIDLKGGRIYVPIGYESTMSPYRPMYSAAYLWLYSQTGAATGGTATWHTTPRLDVIAGVTLGYNTFFEQRGDSPSFIGRSIYWLTPEKDSKAVFTLYTGAAPIAAAKGHFPRWQTVTEYQWVRDWSRRLTTACEFNLGWDDHDDPQDGGGGAWYGGYLMATTHLHPQLDLNLRGEGFADADGSRTGNAATYGEFTLSFNFMPKTWLNFRPEIRWDIADHEVFGASQLSQAGRDEQLTLAVDCLVKF